MLSGAAAKAEVAPVKNKNPAEAKEFSLHRKLVLATMAAGRLSALQTKASQDFEASGRRINASKHVQKALIQSTETAKAQVPHEDPPTTVFLHKHDWQSAYRNWRHAFENHAKRPYDQQWQIFDAIHQRCVLEYNIEQESLPLSADVDGPLLRLVHGLPGSGKSEVLKVLKTYFEDVWGWSLGVHFMFIAPLNSMAAGIGGATLHSFCDVAWTTKRGVTIQPKNKSEDNVSSSGAKYSRLRFLFIDEAEACGCELLAESEQNVTTQSKNVYKYRNEGADTVPRAFGGVNVCYLGDFWQLPPTGAIAIMSHPLGAKAREDADVAHIMLRFWRHDGVDPLQSWNGDDTRVLSLTQNKRSGQDPWYSEVLDACRLGRLSNVQYNFLHGFPTSVCGSWTEEGKRSSCENSACRDFTTRFIVAARDTSQPWQESWRVLQASECFLCQTERKRRARVLGCGDVGGMTDEEITQVLGSERFAESVFITECNQPVCLYSMLRGKDFARRHGAQLLWVQAEDSPPAEHFDHYSKNDLAEMKERWLGPAYHARRTEGILSLLPVVYDMPMRVTLGNGRNFKDYGVHNGSRCRLKAWTLHAEDEITLKASNDEQVILGHLPAILWVEMERPLTKAFPGAPKSWFPIYPLTIQWCLDKGENIHISRKGFPVVPDFSSTVHLATGRTLKSIIGDLGDFEEPPSFSSAMRGYIILRRGYGTRVRDQRESKTFP